MSVSGNEFRKILRNLLLSAGTVAATTALIASCSGPVPSEGSLGAPHVEAIAAQGWELIKMSAYNYADTQLDSFGHFTTTPNGCHQDAEGALDLTLWNQIAQLMNKALSKPLLPQSNEGCFARPNGSTLFGTVDVIVDPPTPNGRQAAYAEEPVADPTIPWPFPSWFPNPFSPASPTPTVEPTGTPTPTTTVTATPTPTWTPTHTPSHSPNPFPSASFSASPSPTPSGITETLFENNGDQICTTIQDQSVAESLVRALDQVSQIAYKEDCPQAQ